MAAICIAAGAVSLLHYRKDLSLRREAERFAARHGLDDLRPLDAGTRRLEPAGDLALAAAASSALSPPEPLPAQGPATKPPVSEKALAEARSLLLEALRERPGWPYHRVLLGRTEYALFRRGGAADDPERWALALRLAADAAPGIDSLWTFLAGAYLESWPRLSPERRAEAAAVFARAFRDAGFVSDTFLPAASALGMEQALGLLPSAADSLQAAFDQLAKKEDLRTAARLLDRLAEAEWRARAADMAHVEERYRLGEVDGLRLACRDWVDSHPVEYFDDPKGRAQAARVLELWPNYRPGTWSGDPRGRLVRFFLNGRSEDVKPDALLRAVQALSGVPAPVAARVRLMAGDAYGAESAERHAADAGSFDWTAYLVERAQYELARRRTREARAALRRVPPAARQQCDVLLARREVAAALSDAAEARAVEQGLSLLARDVFPSEVSRRQGAAVSLCLDSRRGGPARLDVELQPVRPAIVAYGWNGGRVGTLFVDRQRRLSLALPQGEGTRTFSLLAQAGDAPQFVATLARRR
jgi:hypothetical protein